MGDNSDNWKTPAARKTILNNMEMMLRRAGKVDESMYAKLPDFENRIFNESSSQDVYRNHLSKLINHLNNPGARQVQQQQQQQAAMQQQQQAMSMQQQAGMQQQPQQPMGMHQQSQQPMGMQQPPQQPMGVQQAPHQPMGMQQQQPQIGVPQHMGMRQPQPMGHNQSMMPMTNQQPNVGPPMPAVPQPAQVPPGLSQHMPPVSQQQQLQPGLQQRLVSHPTTAGDQLPGDGYVSSPATSQIPQLSSRMQYSPGSSGLPMPSPNARMMRVPQPSPSMSMSINTPNPSVMTPQEVTMASPASYNPMSQQSQPPPPSTPDDDQMYVDKMRELSVYREPLKKMISDMGKDNRTQQVEYKKLCALLSVLEPTVNQKTSYEMLCKYEDVLKKLVPKLKTAKEGIHWCQPFLTAVAESMKSPMGKSALRQTFGPAVHTLYGPDLSSPSIPTSRKRKISPTSQSEIPNLIQGELARLNHKFKVSRDLDGTDSADPYRTNVLRLQCCLEEKGLPSVPPLKFTLLRDYPVTNPQWDKSMKFYNDSDFLLDVKKRTTNGLLKLQNKFSMTAMLETWSASVRQACIGLS